MNLNPETTDSSSPKEKSSFTADAVAWRRTFTDIPFSNEIFEIVQRIQGPFNPEAKETTNHSLKIVPRFEARYLMTDRLVEESKPNQIFELASGLSPRGLVMTKSNPDINYVEMDLYDKMQLKRQVVFELSQKVGNGRLPSNLLLLDGNVVQNQNFMRARIALNCCADRCVISEGLLRYLNWNDKAAVARNTYDFIGAGGMWITPDLEFLCDINASPEMVKVYDRRASARGFDVRPFLFKDMDDAVSFFERLRFKVQKYNHLDIISQLVSPSRLSLNDKDVREDLSRRYTFVLTKK